MIIHICDKCGKDYSGKYLNSVTFKKSSHNMQLCDRCFYVYEKLIKEAEEKFLLQNIESMTVDGKEHNLVYGSYSQHDCESWYYCPICGESYGSWGFFNKGMNAGDKFECSGCKNILIVPK